MTCCFICGKNVGKTNCNKHTELEWLFWYRNGYSPLKDKKEFDNFIKNL